MIGSLVVCLPVKHKGGSLVVRKAAGTDIEEERFDFGYSNPLFGN